jgi:hypothetical protein
MHPLSFALIVADARPSLLTTRAGKRLRTLALALARANVPIHTSMTRPVTGARVSWAIWGRRAQGYRTSAFHRSRLAEELRAQGVRHVFVAGGADGVLPTASHALDAGFEVTLLTDATSVNAAFAHVRLPFARCRDMHHKIPRSEHIVLAPCVSLHSHQPNTCMLILAR